MEIDMSEDTQLIIMNLYNTYTSINKQQRIAAEASLKKY